VHSITLSKRKKVFLTKVFKEKKEKNKGGEKGGK
jgi:hypothetical protein